MGNAPSTGTGSDSPESSLFHVDPNSPHVKRIMEARNKLTGEDRLRLMFTLNEFDEVSPEVKRIVFGTMMGTFAGAFMGIFGRGRIAYEDFMRSNMHEVFNTPLEAKRQLQDKVTLGMGQGAYRVGWRLGLFTGIYMTVSTMVATYRGKNGVVDQVVGAGSAGFIYKLHQGPKASISGLVFGGILGSIAGLMTLLVTKMTGTTIDKANLYYYQSLTKKEEKIQASKQSARDFLREYDQGADEERDQFLNLAHFHDKLFSKTDKENLLIASGKAGDLEAKSSTGSSKDNVSNNVNSPSSSATVAALSQSSVPVSPSNNKSSEKKT